MAQATLLYLPRSMARMVPAGPKFEVLAANPLGDPCRATPAISDGMIFIRTQHYLFGIGRGSEGVNRLSEARKKSVKARRDANE
jgi:hypothetical protein